MSNFTVRELTLDQFLENTAARFPDTDAVIHAGRESRQTRSEFSTCVDDMARGLMVIGVQKGEKVTAWTTNVPHWMTLMFATTRIGTILVTVSTNYYKTELRYLLQQSEYKSLFIIDSVRDHDFITSTYEVLPELRHQWRGMLGVEGLPHLKRIFFLDTGKHRGICSLPELFPLAGDVSDKECESRKTSIPPYNVVNARHTSGTTGFPKGVMLTHVNIVDNSYWIDYYQKFSSRDWVYLPVPLFHCFGCTLGVMTCVNHGTTVVLPDTFSPVQVMTAVEQEKCTILYDVSTMFQAILDHRVFSCFDFSSLCVGIMAGSVCPEPLIRRAMDQVCMSEIIICCGLIEGSPVMTQTRTDDTVERRVKTMGRSMPGIEVTIRNLETNEEAPRSTVGEVCCRGYNAMQGYYNIPKDTAEAINEEGWLHSNDLGITDEDGYINVSGRIRDMIVRGGENVYPREVEELLLKIDGVADVQVVAVPNRRYGEGVGVFLTPKEGADVAPEDVRGYCRGKIAWYKVPHYVAVVGGFPLTTSGKIQKYKLREMAATYFPETMRERSGLPSRGRRDTAWYLILGKGSAGVYTGGHVDEDHRPYQRHELGKYGYILPDCQSTGTGATRRIPFRQVHPAQRGFP